jgi:hypothetical protein
MSSETPPSVRWDVPRRRVRRALTKRHHLTNYKTDIARIYGMSIAVTVILLSV